MTDTKTDNKTDETATETPAVTLPASPLWDAMQPQLLAAAGMARKSFEDVQKYNVSDKSLRELLNEEPPKEYAALTNKVEAAKTALENARAEADKFANLWIAKMKTEKGENEEAEKIAREIHAKNVSAYRDLRNALVTVLSATGVDPEPFLDTLPNIGGVRKSSATSEGAGTRGPNVGGHDYIVNGQPVEGSLRKICSDIGQDFDEMSAAFFKAAGTNDLKTLPVGHVTKFEHNGVKIEATRVKKAGRPATGNSSDNSSAESESDQ